MRLHRFSLNDTDSLNTSAVVAIGNFDGVHPGHQTVLRAARETGTPLAVLTFSPHPREYFDPTCAPLSIYPLRRKLELLAQEGVGQVYLARFDAAFAALSPAAFVQRVLLEKLGARHVVTGEHFIFGQGRAGNAAILAQETARHCIGYTPVADAAGYSSSSVRHALKAGDMQAAARGLSRSYTIEGHVMHGDKRGRQLGFPTANIGLNGIVKPMHGVYAVRVHASKQILNGVANLGTRPSVGGLEPRLEVHCFDFKGDLYGQRLKVELLHNLRPEQRFESLEALTAQIAHDCASARDYLGGLEFARA